MKLWLILSIVAVLILARVAYFYRDYRHSLRDAQSELQR